MSTPFGTLGTIAGAIFGGIALFMLMLSGAGDNVAAIQTLLLAAGIVFGCGLIAGAIERN